MSDTIWYLSFSVLLHLLIASWSKHTAANELFHPSLRLGDSSTVYVDHVFFTHASTDGCLGFFLVLAIV